jgi:hypothetical protein
VSQEEYRLRLGQVRLNRRQGLEAVVSVFRGDTLVDENLVNLSRAEERKAHALSLSERFAIDQAEEKLLQLMQVAREQLEAGGEANPKESPATQLVRLAQEQGAELWHSLDMEPFATIPVQGHRENWRLPTRGFRQWLARKYYEATQKVPGSQALQDALSVLGGISRFDGPEHPVFTRLAWHDGVIYLDLCNQDWEVMEVTAAGWRCLTDPPVRFRRARGMLPLARPAAGGSVAALRRFINCADEDWPLVLAWLVAGLRPTGPYPVLPLHGEQGSAKTTTARVLRDLVDPNLASLRSEPRDPRDLIIASTNGWVVALDNLSGLPPWLSDAICRLATGGGFGTRQLYTDDEETLFNARRPVILNGITELATRGDLLDRAIPLYLPAIPEDQRRAEAEFWQEFEAARPAILGALLDAVVHALGQVDRVHLQQRPRMADFALWATAAEPALGLEPGAFMEAYTNNRNSANELTLDVSPIVAPLRELLELADWMGTATSLLADLNAHASEKTQGLKTWPKSGQALSNALRRLAPNLRAAGVLVKFTREAHTGRRLIVLEKSRNSASPSSPSSPSDTKAPVEGDARPGGEVLPGDAEEPSVTPGPSYGDSGDAGDARIPAYSHEGDDEEAF